MDDDIRRLLNSRKQLRQECSEKATSIVRENEPLLAPMHPTKLCEEVCVILEEYLESGAPLSTACKAVGISPATYSKWMQRGLDEEEPYLAFRTRVEAAKARFEISAIATMRRAAGEGKWQAAAWLLERQNPEEFGKKEKVEHKHDHEHTVQVHAVAKLPDNRRGDREVMEAEVLEVKRLTDE